MSPQRAIEYTDLMKKMKIKKETLKRAGIIAGGAAVAAAIVLLLLFGTKRCSHPAERSLLSEEEEMSAPNLMYGIEYENYDVITEKVGSGQTLSHILDGLGVGPATVDRIDRESRSVFDMRGMRAGQPYTAFMEHDSLGRRLRHFVYEKNPTDYIVVSLAGDSVTVRQESKEVKLVRRKETAKIDKTNNSLWNATIAAGMPASIPCEMEDIFGWSVDFFGLQEGDEFTVIFDERWIDTVRVGTGMVWGAEFRHNGKLYRAIPFRQDGRVAYWDENGNSLRRQFLKAPLKYTRISSRFSPSRLHPIYNVRRPHLGVDYAAPAGTEVVAIADGVVTEKRWDSKGGGNILKIKHANNYISGYLHLKGYARGITVGKRVSQGEPIAYVGSTGASTGPHLDFRIWKNGTAIDPLKIPSDPVEPISPANREAFEYFKTNIIAELEGEVPDDEKIVSLDYTPVQQHRIEDLAGSDE